MLCRESTTQCLYRVSIWFLTKSSTAFVINDILLQSNEIGGTTLNPVIQDHLLQQMAANL